MKKSVSCYDYQLKENEGDNNATSSFEPLSYRPLLSFNLPVNGDNVKEELLKSTSASASSSRDQHTKTKTHVGRESPSSPAAAAAITAMLMCPKDPYDIAARCHDAAESLMLAAQRKPVKFGVNPPSSLPSSSSIVQQQGQGKPPTSLTNRHHAFEDCTSLSPSLHSPHPNHLTNQLQHFGGGLSSGFDSSGCGCGDSRGVVVSDNDGFGSVSCFNNNHSFTRDLRQRRARRTQYSRRHENGGGTCKNDNNQSINSYNAEKKKSCKSRTFAPLSLSTGLKCSHVVATVTSASANFSSSFEPFESDESKGAVMNAGASFPSYAPPLSSSSLSLCITTQGTKKTASCLFQRKSTPSSADTVFFSSFDQMDESSTVHGMSIASPFSLSFGGCGDDDYYYNDDEDDVDAKAGGSVLSVILLGLRKEKGSEGSKRARNEDVNRPNEASSRRVNSSSSSRENIELCIRSEDDEDDHPEEEARRKGRDEGKESTAISFDFDESDGLCNVVPSNDDEMLLPSSSSSTTKGEFCSSSTTITQVEDDVNEKTHHYQEEEQMASAVEENEAEEEEEFTDTALHAAAEANSVQSCQLVLLLAKALDGNGAKRKGAVKCTRKLLLRRNPLSKGGRTALHVALDSHPTNDNTVPASGGRFVRGGVSFHSPLLTAAAARSGSAQSPLHSNTNSFFSASTSSNTNNNSTDEETSFSSPTLSYPRHHQGTGTPSSTPNDLSKPLKIGLTPQSRLQLISLCAGTHLPKGCGFFDDYRVTEERREAATEALERLAAMENEEEEEENKGTVRTTSQLLPHTTYEYPQTEEPPLKERHAKEKLYLKIAQLTSVSTFYDHSHRYCTEAALFLIEASCSSCDAATAVVSAKEVAPKITDHREATAEEERRNEKVTVLTGPAAENLLTATDKKGLTPLHIAIANCNYIVAERLLAAGADPNVKAGPEEDCNTPLHFAVLYTRRLGSLFVDLLLSHGAVVEDDEDEYMREQQSNSKTGSGTNHSSLSGFCCSGDAEAGIHKKQIQRQDEAYPESSSSSSSCKPASPFPFSWLTSPTVSSATTSSPTAKGGIGSDSAAHLIDVGSSNVSSSRVRNIFGQTPLTILGPMSSSAVAYALRAEMVNPLAAK